MTLKEKFKQWLDTNPWLKIREVQLEKIADDYAIEFGEWLISRAAGETGLKLRDDVLQIFKKEKGL